MAHEKPKQELVNHLTELFKFAFEHAQESWQVADRHTNAYDRIINYEEWPTISEMMIPLSMMAVDQLMAFVWDYVLPRTPNWVNLIPRDEALPFGTVDAVNNYLNDMIRHKIRLRRKGYATLKDAVKIGVGYGIVEPKQIRPERSVTKIVELMGEIVGQESAVEDGAAEMVENYRHAQFKSVVPMPDGQDPDEVSGVFFLDFKYDDELKQMYEVDRALPKNRRVLEGDPAEIIKNTIDRKMNGNARPSLDIMSMMAGVDRLRSGQDASNMVKGDDAAGNSLAKAVVSVPILKCYFRGHHVWLANGDTVIYDVKDAGVTRKCPIVMAQTNPDSGKWFTPGIVAASEDPDHATNVFYNALLDILTYHLNPTRIVDKRALAGGVMPPHEPFQDIEVYGQPKDAIQYAAPPPVSPGILAIGDALQQFGASAKGQPLAMQGQASPGLLRGGVGAFESLLSGSFGRQKMIGALMETGWLESTVVRLLSLSQAIITGKGKKFISEREGPDGRPEFYEQRVSPDEIRHAYDVRINLEEKYQNAVADESMKMQRFSILKDDPYIEPYEARFDVLGGGDDARRWLGSRDRAEKTRQQIIEGAAAKLAEIQAAQIAQQEAQGGPAQSQEPGLDRTQQALAGGAAQVSGLGG